MHRFSRASLASLLALMTSALLHAQTPASFSVGQVSADAGQKTAGFLKVPACP